MSDGLLVADGLSAASCYLERSDQALHSHSADTMSPCADHQGQMADVRQSQQIGMHLPVGRQRLTSAASCGTSPQSIDLMRLKSLDFLD